MLEGGLNIRDPGMANFALGGKILWKLYSNKSHLVSQLLRQKYLNGSSLRHLHIDNIPNGTLLWNIYRQGFDFFQRQLSRVPRNGKKSYALA